MSELKRPSIKVPWSAKEKILNVIALLFIIETWCFAIYNWGRLPKEIPSHFSASGTPISWEGKGILFSMPIVATVLYIILLVVSRIPQYYNYAVQITEQNVERQYRNARTLMLWLNVEIIFTLLYIEYEILQGAYGKNHNNGIWLVFMILAVIFGTIGIFIYRMIKLK